MIIKIFAGNNDRDNGVSVQFDWEKVMDTGNYAQPNLWGSLNLK